jgi:hypothetical protein
MLLVERLVAPAMRGRGKMTTPEIYRAVKVRAGMAHLKLSPKWRATVRNTLQRYCEESEKFTGEVLFIHHEKGVWELRHDA